MAAGVAEADGRARRSRGVHRRGALDPPGDPPLHPPDGEHVHPRADHQRPVGASLDAGELGAGLGDEARPHPAQRFEAEDQRVVGEVVGAAQDQQALRDQLGDVEAGDGRADLERPRPARLGVGAADRPRVARRRPARGHPLDRPQQRRPDDRGRRVELDRVLVDPGQLALGRPRPRRSFPRQRAHPPASLQKSIASSSFASVRRVTATSRRSQR